MQKFDWKGEKGGGGVGEAEKQACPHYRLGSSGIKMQAVYYLSIIIFPKHLFKPKFYVKKTLFKSIRVG